jgi:uncharacterized damage-inducible protein DinB
MDLNSKDVLKDLDTKLDEIIAFTKSLSRCGDEELSTPPAQGSWSVLECLEHLNRYAEFYIPEFKSVISNGKPSLSETYKPGWFGYKSAKDMLPTDTGVKNPMKTFKSKNPSITGPKLNRDVIDLFLKHQESLKKIVSAAEVVNLGRSRIRTTLPLIKFKLGDGLQFVIFHQVRHIAQAKRALNAVQESIAA